MFGRKTIAEFVEADENLIPLAIDASERRLRDLPPQGDLWGLAAVTGAGLTAPATAETI